MFPGRRPATRCSQGRRPATRCPQGRSPATRCPQGRRPATRCPQGRRPATVGSVPFRGGSRVDHDAMRCFVAHCSACEQSEHAISAHCSACEQSEHAISAHCSAGVSEECFAPLSERTERQKVNYLTICVLQRCRFLRKLKTL